MIKLFIKLKNILKEAIEKSHKEIVDAFKETEELRLFTLSKEIYRIIENSCNQDIYNIENTTIEKLRNINGSNRSYYLVNGYKLKITRLYYPTDECYRLFYYKDDTVVSVFAFRVWKTSIEDLKINDKLTAEEIITKLEDVLKALEPFKIKLQNKLLKDTDNKIYELSVKEELENIK